MDVRNIYAMYEPDLSQVEEILRESVQSRNPLLTEAAVQLLEAGGKRIRPLFALIGSRFGTAQSDLIYVLASALELVHMATLVHDDVIDDAPTRRGKPTIRAWMGNHPAMYTGDFLFARAIDLLSHIDDPAIHSEMSMAMVRMCEGEIEQIRDFYDLNQPLRNYLRRVERKTALLISVSCSLGAKVAGSPESTVKTLRQFGYYTGMAFQITDDILDYVGDEKTVGKPVGGDLRQGNLSLPALYAAASSPHAQALRQLIHEGMDRDAVEQAILLVRDSDALTFAKDIAERYMLKAMQALSRLEPSPVRDNLAGVAEFVNNRKF
ncbi:polyprenyl synthetase family protein [Alicyclobacillus tolerans]|uniref:polyprenyl synthetase family protein n=1 Tax=Alicyclobacillus tolerans TaxID=90970 RepID=UPI001F21DE18|nr:polyprenyl synthetase family protein [Alicyclobacillus tolerans]MCF8563734.1 polyprenyl synthetase family protein [Alicyclobacillus tolerans]